MRGAAARFVRVLDLVVVEAVLAGERAAQRRKADGVPMPDVGRGGGEDVELDRDGGVREDVRRRPEHRRDLVGLTPRAAIHPEAMLAGVLPELP